METLAAVGVGAQLAAVARLIASAIGLISKIKGAADKARQNRRECAHLELRVSLIADLLPLLHDPAVAQTLAALGYTLQEAHDLVVSCQNQGATGQLLDARGHAERFMEVHRRIDSHLLLIPLASHISITRRLDQILALNHTGRPNPSTISCSLKLEPATVSSSSCVIPSSRAADSFTSTEIAMATGNFTLVLGEDSSGTLYKGRLHDGREVAVKRQGQHADQGAFVAEFEILYRLRHDHIVHLVGWCAEEEGNNILIYDYHQTRNGTLRNHLCGGSPVTASWRMRIQALLGASRAIDHLHRAAVPRIIHRNISSSNILVDTTWAPRVSDFRYAVWQSEPTGEEYGLGQLVGEVVGTFGYVDPVYSRTKRVSPASDVYSFGVVMLEVLTGRPPVAASSSKEKDGAMTLAGFALPIIESGRPRDVLDSRPTPEPTPRQLEALELVAYAAAPCLGLQGRPAMSYVVAVLERALELICG